MIYLQGRNDFLPDGNELFAKLKWIIYQIGMNYFPGRNDLFEKMEWVI